MSLITRCRVPDSLESVTTIRPNSEARARDLGVRPAGVETVWRAVERLYQSGIHPAIQLCVRRHGQVLIDRAIGHAAGNGPDDPPSARKVLATPDTPFTIFSAAKAVTAMVIHLLDQQHLVHLNDPVCEYIPELGVRAKRWITIQHVLTHRAGIPNLPPEVMQLDHLGDRETIVRLMCEAQPTWRPGRQLAYHAISGGFILGEVVQRVTGKDIRTVLRRQILRPLGFRGVSYGVPKRDVHRVARNYFTGPPVLPPLSTLLRRAFGLSFRELAAMSNDPRFLTAIIPSGNVVATANEMSRFYQMLMNGGELDGVSVFEPRTVRRATTEHSYLELDLTLGVPLRYGMGFMLGGQWLSPYGPDTRHAFGHIGFTNVLTWADPERQIAVGLMTSGKPLAYPEIYFLYDILRQVGLACPKVKERPRAAKPAKKTRPAPKKRPARK